MSDYQPTIRYLTLVWIREALIRLGFEESEVQATFKSGNETGISLLVEGYDRVFHSAGAVPQDYHKFFEEWKKAKTWWLTMPPDTRQQRWAQLCRVNDVSKVVRRVVDAGVPIPLHGQKDESSESKKSQEG